MGTIISNYYSKYVHVSSGDHARQMHPNTTRHMALPLDEEVVADVAYLQGVWVALSGEHPISRIAWPCKGNPPPQQPLALHKLLQHLLHFLLPHLFASELINQVQNVCRRSKASF